MRSPESFQHRDNFELNSNRRRQRTDLDRRACRIWFAVPRKVLCVKFIVGWEILFHVRQEHGDIDNVVPARTSVFEYETHIFKHGTTLRFDIIADNVARLVERDARYFLAAALAWSDAGKKQKVSNTFRVRERAYRLRGTGAFDVFAHLLEPQIIRMNRIASGRRAAAAVFSIMIMMTLDRL